MFIDSALDLARVAQPVNNSLFGVEVEALTVGEDIPEGTSVAVDVEAMFLLAPQMVSFRADYRVHVEAVFATARIDVATSFSLPEGYEVEKSTFLEFANTVATSNLHTYAQTILNGLLAEMHLPSNLLPPRDASDAPVFRGSKLPEVLSATVMEDLRSDPALSLQ